MAPRRGGVRAASWWAKAWLRAVEESAYGERDLRDGRSLARAGAVGGITVSPGRLLAGVVEDDDVWTVTVDVPVLAEESVAAFGELVAAESGRIAQLLAGDLPLELAEHAEEAGVELLPYGGELGSACTCDGWLDPCPHALAVLTQLAWLIQADPFVLTHLRGLSRDRVLRDLHRITTPREGSNPGPGSPRSPGPGDDVEVDDLGVAEDAAVRAARLLLQDRPFDAW